MPTGRAPCCLYCSEEGGCARQDKEARLVERDVVEVEAQKRRGQALSKAADVMALRNGKEAGETQLQARLLLMQAGCQPSSFPSAPACPPGCIHSRWEWWCRPTRRGFRRS